MDQHSEHRYPCPCGLTPELCREKHITIDRSLENIRTEQTRVREEIRDGFKELEKRLVDKLKTYEDNLKAQLELKDELASEITEGLRKTYKEAMEQMIQGLNQHRIELDRMVKEMEILREKLPSKAIDRIVALEDCKRNIPDDLKINLKGLGDRITSCENFRGQVLLVGTIAMVVGPFIVKYAIELLKLIFIHIFNGGNGAPPIQ